MLFQIYGETAGFQLLGWLMVFVGLILANEFARRTKWGGIACFLVLPAGLTIYFISIYVGAAMGAQWALNNPTYVYMNSWFHYFKLYAATSGIKGALSPDGWWLSSENVWLYGGWWNWLNGAAGIINIFCMTGWWGIYASKDKKDMLWPDMIWLYILAYDVWNFQYTYLNLPTHTWYCGLALLLAPTVANALWNKGGWIQNRANTLALWCMFAQVFPLFQDRSIFTTLPVLYADGFMDAAIRPTLVNPVPQGVISIASLAINVLALALIIKRSKEQKKNPYKQEIFTDAKDFQLAMARAEDK